MDQSDSNQIKKPKVLIADDTPDILEVLRRFVCGTDAYRCVTAVDGRDAINKYEHARAAQDPFQLLILDAAMPYRTGFEVTDYVRRRRKDPVPIVIVTGYVEPLNEAHADFVDADAILGKPFEPEQMKQVLSLANIYRTTGERIAAQVARAGREV